MSAVVYGFVPHQGQQRVIDTVVNGNTKYITVVSPRQQGKSILLVNLILYYAINDKNGPVIGVISPIYGQARKLMEDLYNAIVDSHIIESSNFSNHEIKLKTGAKIKYRSSEREDGIRGETFDYLFIDEAAYQTDDAWKNAIQPTALVKGKKVVIFSTPRGTNNWFYEMYKMGESNEFPNYSSVRMYQGENTLIDQDEIAAAKKALPDHIFRAEYEGEFIEGESTVFSNFKECIYDGIRYAKGQVYVGIDLARKGDYTSCCFMDKEGTVIEMYRINNTSWDNIVSEILSKVRKYKAKVIVEENSIGDVIFEQLKKQWPDTKGFYTTNETKRDIVESLIYSFNSNSIKIPNDNSLIHELEVFEMTYSPQSRTVKYAARPPFNDDQVISLALANHLRTQNYTIGSYAVYGARK